MLPMFLASACWGRGSKTPDEAKARLVAAVTARDPARLWGALDLDTQWSWMTVHRAGRESYDVTLSNLPEGQQRERMIRRFAPAATSENAAALFAKSLSPELWPSLAAQLAAAGDRAPVVNAAGNQAEIVWPAGRLLFRKTSKASFGWGFAGLAAEADALKRTASTDLEALRTNAADYERAAARGLRRVRAEAKPCRMRPSSLHLRTTQASSHSTADWQRSRHRRPPRSPKQHRHPMWLRPCVVRVPAPRRRTARRTANRPQPRRRASSLCLIWCARLA